MGCPRRESNLDLPLRRRSSYPLDYEGLVDGDLSDRPLGYRRRSTAEADGPDSFCAGDRLPARRAEVADLGHRRRPVTPSRPS
jgi:hypothetical protein